MNIAAQSKLNLTAVLPQTLEVCGDEVEFSVNARNITTGTVQNIYLELIFPFGIEYVKSSVSGSGVSERNISNLQRPQFDLPNLSITQSRDVKIKIKANCDILALINAGKLAVVTINGFYSGGSVNMNTSPLSINQPTLQIKSVTNRFAQTDLEEIFYREITLVNSGKGRLSSANFRQINENGLRLLGVSGGSLRFSRDTVFSTFSGTDFQAVGNKDPWLDQNEEIVIYDTLQTRYCNDLNSYFQVSWGCDGKICQKIGSSANVTIKTKLPILTALPKSSLNTCLDSSNSFNESLRIVNTGNDTAKYFELSILQAANTGFYQYMLSRILENSFTYRVGANGKSVKISPSSTTLTYNQGSYSCLGKDPVGEATLNLPNLNPGDTIFIDWVSKSCCPDVCNFNFYTNRWNYKGFYRDQCDNLISLTERRGSNGYYSRLTFTSFAPSDVGSSDTALFSYELTNANFMPGSARSKYIVDFVKPSGLVHSLTKSDFYFIDIRGRKWEPTSIKTVGDTVRAFFYGYLPITMHRAELKIRARVDCSNSQKSGDANYELLVRYNTDTACKKFCTYLMACVNGKINIHCGSSCSGGLRFSDFDVARISYGSPDNDNDGLADASGSLDMDRIKTERVMFGDTLQTTFKGQFLDLGSIRTWRYLKASSYIPYGTYLDVAEARLKIYRNGNLLYSCADIPVTTATSGVNRTYFFDAGVPSLISAKCPLFSGFLFTKRDSVELQIKYVVTRNPGNAIRTVDISNSFYTSTLPNPTAAQRLQCDTFSGRFQFVGYYFTNYGRNLFTTNSCKTIDVVQNFYLSVGNCCGNYAGGNIFPFEYRNWAKLATIDLIPPTGYKTIYSSFIQYRTAGTGFTATDFVDSIKPYAQSGDTVKFKVDQLYEDQSGKVKLSDDGFHGTFRARLLPTCQTSSGESEIEYIFGFQQKGYLGNAIEIIPSGGNSDRLIYDAPSISMAVAEKFVFAKSDTIDWSVRLSNISPSSTAEYLWVSSILNPNVELIAIEVINTGTTVFADSGVFKLDKLANGTSLDLRLRAVFKNCEQDSIKVLIGYDCEGYPSSRTNLKCPALEKYLSYIPINTRLDAELKDSAMVVSLCDDVWYEVEVSNTGEAKVFGLYLDLVLRPGMTLGDSAWLFMESMTDSTLVINPVNTGGQTWRWNIYQFDTLLKNNGLSGIKGDNDLVLKFKLSTDCNFISSSFFLARPGGILKCGKDVFSAYEVGNPIDIDGITKPYFSSISMLMGQLDVCNFNDSIEIKFINLGPDSTSSKDRIQLTLPPGLDLDTAALNALHNGPTGVSRRKLGKSDAVVWDIPQNLKAGDSVHFKSRLVPDLNVLDCGISELLLQALVEQPAFCVKTKTWCNIDVATSSFQILDSVRKSDFYLSFNSAKGKPIGSREEVDLSYTITNKGTPKSTFNNLEIWVVHDKNSNGVYDPSDPVIYRDTLSQKISSDTSFVRDIKFTARSIETCELLLVVDTAACACISRFVVVPPVSIDNAGNDTIICSGETAQIGLSPSSGNTYKWNSHVGIKDLDSASTSFQFKNIFPTDLDVNLILSTNKGRCSSTDTVQITVRPAIDVNLKDTVALCTGNRAFIGETARGGSGNLTYQWFPTNDLSNPTSSRTWAEPATSMSYKIIITDKENCTLEDSTFVQILKLPVAAMSVRDTCADSLFQFFNNSTTYNGSFFSYFWNIGSEVSDKENPVLSISTTGRHPVNLMVTDSMGCSASTSDTFEIFDNPVAGMILSDFCVFDTVLLRGTSTYNGNSVRQIWHINKVQTIADDLKYSSGNSGMQRIQLQAISPQNCSNWASDTLYIHDRPKAVTSSTNVCDGVENIFYAQVQVSSPDTITSSLWKLSDGSSYGQDTIQHKFNSVGTFDAELVAISSFGCTDTFRTSADVYPNPIATLNTNDVCIGDDLLFKGQGSISSGSIDKYYWDLGGGYSVGVDSIRLATPNVGFHRADLIVESDQNCRDTTSINAFVHGLDLFSISQNLLCEYDSIELTQLSRNPDSISRIKWTFHDQDSAFGNSVKKKYSSFGIYDADIQIDLNSGCSQDTSIKIIVRPAPVAALIGDLPCDDMNIRVIDQSTTSLGSIVRQSWQLNGTNFPTSDSLKVEATTKSTQKVFIEVENTFGCIDTASVIINPFDNPDLDFEVENVCFGLPVHIRDRSSTGQMTISQKIWDTGDGNSILDKDSFLHYYASPGNYAVGLELTNSKGCKYTASKTLTIYDLPVSGFKLFPDKADVLNSDIEITDESIGADSVFYRVSDGTLFVGRNFTHEFLDSGSYQFTQWVSNSFGCRDTSDKWVRINFRVAIWVPNSFTPNGDGRNDVFRPYGDGIGTYSLRIFNRWGEKIYHSDNGVPWDGKNAIPGVYLYRLDVSDYDEVPHYFMGKVHLIK